MIEAEIAKPAEELLSECIASLVEAEHTDMISTCPPEEAPAKAERLEQLGADIAHLARALSVILRRSGVEAGSC